MSINWLDASHTQRNLSYGNVTTNKTNTQVQCLKNINTVYLQVVFVSVIQ